MNSNALIQEAVKEGFMIQLQIHSDPGWEEISCTPLLSLQTICFLTKKLPNTIVDAMGPQSENPQ